MPTPRSTTEELRLRTARVATSAVAARTQYAGEDTNQPHSRVAGVTEAHLSVGFGPIRPGTLEQALRDVGLQAGFDRGMRPAATRPYPHASSLVQTLPSRDIKCPTASGGPPLRVSVLMSLLGKVSGVPIFAPRGGRKRHFHRSVRSIPGLRYDAHDMHEIAPSSPMGVFRRA